MIERGQRPGTCVVTCCTGSWEACRHVVRIVCGSVIASVAAVTVCRQRCVVVIRMALRALNVDVCSCQWERSVVVIER